MKKTKFLKRGFIVLIIIGLIIVHFIFPRLITETRNPIIALFKNQKVVNTEVLINENTKVKRKKLTVTSFDDVKLSALLTYSKSEIPKSTIILLHGSSHNKEHFLELSEFLSLNGFNSVALDIRGFGESEGQFFTYGVKESKDIQILIDHLINKEGFDHIGIWGQSIGGALVLQTMGIEKRIKYGISESSYTSLKSNVQSFFKRHAGFSLAIFSDYLVDRSGSIGNFDADEASPYKSSKNITQPILVVHGGKDKQIPIEEGRANYNNIKSKDKKFLEIEEAGHSDLWQVGGDAYFNSVLLFLNKQASTFN
ncbi:alpha/beta hydrolase [Winogradskyella wichelsiae]|uniref:alpha/beta hydrolase n=1 Tax=Winogradskyella wichelsiae TaxID=2697007 RepID=UPI003EF76442